MSFRKSVFLLWIAGSVAGLAWPQAAGEEYRVYTSQPRLFLRPRRLRLLQRERERQSIRWQQLQTVMAAKSRLAEPGFGLALFSRVTGDQSYCRQAADWALGPAGDLRQLALIYDWCQPALGEKQRSALEKKLEEGSKRKAGEDGVAAVRDRVLAAVSIADQAPQFSEQELRWVAQTWWRGRIAPALKAGRKAVPRDQLYALFEILHAFRDNLNIDLREAAPFYFRDLPNHEILSYYPSPYPAAENLYWIPAVKGGGEPDLRRAALSRAAEFAMVAYDPNSQGNQFLQGWLIHDQFLMRGAFGASYEFLWANPYLPGLSYYHLPLAFHDETAGSLFLRSSWDDDATWLGYFEGELQVFERGELKIVTQQPASKPIRLGDALVIVARKETRFAIGKPGVNVVFLVGLEPSRKYEVEVDDQEMDELTADPGGILTLKVASRPGLEARIRPVAAVAAAAAQ